MKTLASKCSAHDLLFLSTFAILIVGFIVSGYIYNEKYTNEFNANVARRLSTISELKADAVTRWREARVNDAGIFYKNAEFSALVQKCLSHAAARNEKNALNALMSRVYNSHEYEGVYLLDINCSEKVSMRDGDPLAAPVISREALDRVRACEVVVGDLENAEAARRMFINIIVPISNDPAHNRVIGMLVLRIDPCFYLYPLLRRWPSGSQSGETYIIRRERNELVFLNPLRRRTELPFRTSLKSDDTSRLVAVREPMKNEEVVEGIDYSGAEVVADVRVLPDSPWCIVSQFDKSEIYASYRERRLTVVGTVLLLVLSAGTTLGFAFKQKSVKFLRMQLDAAKALHESEANHSITLNSIGDGVISTDVKGNIIQLNPVAERLCGWSTSEAQGQPLLDVFRIYDADTRQPIDNPVVRVMETGTIIELANHTVLLSKEGREHQIADSAAPIRDAGEEILGVVIVFSDITDKHHALEALRESESRYKMLAENSFDVIWTRDMTGGYTYISPSVEQLRGFTPEEILHQPFEMEICPESQKIMMESLQQMLLCAHTRQHVPIETVEVEQPCKDGSSVWTEIVMRIMFDESGEGVGIIGISRNIQERKRSEQALQHVQRMESIGVLAGGIAHDFNNLLGTMMGNVSLAQTLLPADHPAINKITKALAAMESASKLTQQMLAYSGKGKYHTCTLDIAALVQEHVSFFQVSLAKKVKLETHFPSTPIYINGDSGQIEQVVMNLIINGGEAIGIRNGIVSVSMSVVTMSREELLPYGRLTNSALKSGSYALLEVSDNGSGMNRDVLAKIFEPFYTTKFTGRGLGLSAVLGIINGHRGGITVESRDGEGTTFRVLLPACAPPKADTELPAECGHPFPAVTTTVLIIDDDANIASIAGEIVEAGQYKAIIELNPLLAIDTYKHHRSDIGLVLLDLTMPEMSGKEVVLALKTINPNIRIIISSGYSEAEMQKEIGPGNVAGFIEKPYRMQALLNLVQRVIN